MLLFFGELLLTFSSLAGGYSHSIMISAYCRQGLFEEAKQLAKDFEAQYDKYDLVILNSMLCAYCRADDMESVMRTLRKMDELRISPGYNTFHILIKYFCKQKLYLLAYRTMEDMHRKGHQPQEVMVAYIYKSLGQLLLYLCISFLIQLELMTTCILDMITHNHKYHLPSIFCQSMLEILKI